MNDSIPRWPRVTVNILTFNREHELRITLNKILHELDYPKDRLEIIVCDNASADGTPEMLKKEFPSVKHLRMPENMGTPSWNRGFESGTGDYFLLLDDDGHLEGDTLKKAVAFLEEKIDAGIVSFNVIDPETRYSYTLHFPFGIFSFWGCAVVVRRKLIEAVGGFDPNIFIYSHEPEFVIRAAKAGFKHHVMAELTAYHRKDPSKYNEYSDFKCFNENFSRNYTYFKHLHSAEYVKYAFNALLRSLQGTLLLSLHQKKINLVLLKSLFKAWNLGRKSTYQHDKAIEKFTYENDQRCVPVGAKLLSMPSKTSRDFYVNFFEKRKDLYPDYDEKYLWKWIPFN